MISVAAAAASERDQVSNCFLSPADNSLVRAGYGARRDHAKVLARIGWKQTGGFG
jgi:hypothetical protein